MRLCASIAALLPAAAGATEPWVAPDLGSAYDLLDRERYACAAPSAQTQCWLQSSAGLHLNGIDARGQLLTYRAGTLQSVSTTVDERRFDDLLHALEARFGPGEHSTERLRAGMGGVFSNRLVLWRLPDKVVLLEQYFERVTQSAVSVMTPESFAALMAARDSVRVRGARDL
jgi:hypothetical protein